MTQTRVDYTKEDLERVEEGIRMAAAKWCHICGGKWCLEHDPQKPLQLFLKKRADMLADRDG